MEKQIYKIKKIKAVDNPKHGIIGYGDIAEYFLGYYTKEPTTGERFNLTAISYRDKPHLGGISTSVVTKIIDENTFETLNSIYHWEKYNE